MHALADTLLVMLLPIDVIMPLTTSNYGIAMLCFLTSKYAVKRGIAVAPLAYRTRGFVGEGSEASEAVGVVAVGLERRP